MKKLIPALLALIAAPAFAASTYSVSGWTAKAGQPETFTIRRVSGTDPGYVSFRTNDGTGKAKVDYSPVVGRLYFKRGQASRTITLATFINSAKLGQTLNFSGTISVNGVIQSSAGAFIVEPPALAAAPLPVSPPPVATGWLPSPSLAGLPAIASPFDVTTALQPSWGSGAIPPSSAPDDVGAFRFICRDAGDNNDDPIVYPGQPGKSHGHQYYCHGADAFTTYQSLRTGAGPFNGKAMNCVNCSAYWMPQMLDSAGNIVKPSFVSIYYKRRPQSDPKCSLTSGDPQAEGNCLPIPNGLKFIFGYDMLSGKAPTGQLYFNCQNGPVVKTATPGVYPNINVALANCPAGNLLGSVIIAPSCWDGKNLDSPNHRDHVAYPGYGDWGYLRCPVDHPYVIPTFTLGAWFPVAPGMHLSSDVTMNAVPGTTFHADYFEAWDPTVKAMWTDNCINKMLNCSGGDLGNGLQLRNAQ